MALLLRDRGENVVVIDNLSTGFRDAIPSSATFVAGDVGDQSLIVDTIREHEVSDVIHFAGSTVVPESMRDPLEYYRNNTTNTRNLLAACVEGGVKRLVFSSTAAVYGIPTESRVSEGQSTTPISPYGASKLMAERMIEDAGSAHGLRYAILRYFNVAGAEPSGRAGQRTANATHLIKVAIDAALGRREAMTVFGSDYDTRDGTGVRDYIHVWDLVDAHRQALHYLASNADNLVLNCGYGRGYSVREIIEAVERATGSVINVIDGPRRPGDAAEVIADNHRIRTTLGWTPSHDDLADIIGSVLNFEQKFS